MNKGLRPISCIICIVGIMQWIWNWDLMNKGLRLHFINTAPSNIFYIWNWDLMNKGLRRWRFAAIACQANDIWNWDLMNKGLRLVSYTSISLALITTSETETWWIRDWDKMPAIIPPFVTTGLWNWDLMNKGLRLRNIRKPKRFCFFWSETETWWIRDWDLLTTLTT